MSTLKLNSISEVKTEKDRKDGKSSRNYYVATFTNPSNPFSKAVSRVFWQQHNADGTKAEWRGADPKDVKAFIGKEIPGRIVSSQVEAYDIEVNGEVREANTYTAVVLDGENAVSVFKQSNKVILEAAPSMVVRTENVPF